MTAWAAARDDLRALALVGSQARGTAGPDSDIDLILLAVDPAAYRADTAWLHDIAWPGGPLNGWHDADYGAVWSRHVTLESGHEVELSFAMPGWAATDPVDPGTRRVVGGGLTIFLDRDGALARLAAAVGG